MVIVVSCDVLGEKNNGTTLAAYNLIGALKKMGHEVRVICSDPERRGESGFFVVKRLPTGRAVAAYLSKNGVALSWPDHEVVARALEGADAVHVMTPFPLGNYTAREAIKRAIPVTAGFHCQAENITSHAYLKNCRPANALIYKIFYKKLYGKVGAVHFPTRFIRDVFEKYGGKTNGYVISNGVGSEFTPGPAPERSEDSKDEFRILFIGRYSREKSHSVLINAVKKSKYRDRIRLIFAGDGPLKDKLKKKASFLPIEPVFRFFGRDELIGVIRDADLYVHPAEIEIEAISCLEAIACGAVPVIADSARSATRYFALDEKNLFKNGDSDSLASRIDWWLDHPDEKKKRSEEYAGYAREFSFDECMKKMEEMIKENAAQSVRDS
ncbi:MAG: glycosyltransferase [Clostridia bacterium]|nr:glycosyltransferase [Clostridia bacterium]MBR7033235.1 glycosyltransferase [Clostridia bacterium]